ncbi:MAG: hypothetical protein ACIAZJ_00040 [Gimesia chilikensis]|uniref:hypothetical protein n=1 Tax=Gimesia chilikensis TaxID=2605989 RepID=UPI00378D30C9
MQRSLKTEKIEKHLDVIGILFMVLAGFSLLMVLFIPVHFMMMQSVMNMDFPRPHEGPDPRKMFREMQSAFIVLYVLVGVLSLAFGGFLLATGINIRRKRHFTLCVVGSALICISFPLGTALGIWSLLTLYDKHTRPLFAERTDLGDADFLD